MPSVAISGLTLSRAITSPLTAPTAAASASTASDGRQHHRGLAAHDEGGQHGADADQAADRKVDRAAQDHQRLPERHGAERHHALQQADDARRRRAG